MLAPRLRSTCFLSQVLAMRPWIQGSAAKEEDEHPYELLLTAETKKLVSVDGKTKGRAPTPLLAETAPQGPKETMVFLGLGELGFRAFWVVGVLWPFILIPRAGVDLSPLSIWSKEKVRSD